MASINNILEVSSVNCRGLRDYQKSNDVLHYLREQSSNIICLQDTHWIKEDIVKIKQIWGDDLYINGTKRNARGVAILIRRNFEYTIINTISHIDGNMILIDIKISNDFTLRIINIYAPNKDSPEFFENIGELVNLNQCDYQILCGDFNLTLNPQIDSNNYSNLNNPKSRQQVLNMIDHEKLTDTFRHLYPNTH